MRAKRVSEYGKKWDERVPRFAISWLAQRWHVSRSNEEIAADIRQRCSTQNGYTEALIKQSIAYAIECHSHNQNLYSDVVNGRI